MNKLMFLQRKLLLIGFALALSMTAWSQAVFKNGIKQGVIKVKFTPEMSTTLSQARVSASTNGFTSGIQSVDKVAQATKASNMYRLFPYDVKNETRLRKHGLHLWYVVEINQTTDPKTAVSQFKQLKEVAAAEMEHEKVLAPYEVKPYVPTASIFDVLPMNDPLLKDQWHYHNTGQVGGLGNADINLFEAWKVTTGSNSVIVSVHDQGVDVNHSDLKANMWVNQAEKNGTPGVDDDANGYVDDINGFNFTTNSGAIDPQPHATHVSGTIAAVNNNGIGVSGIAGGNGSGNGVKIMSCEILGGAPIEKSYVYAANNGAVISQNSWGYTSPGFFDQSVLDAIDYFIAEAGNYDGSPMKGGLVLFAAGNSNSSANWYPGYHPATMSVSSIGPEWKKAYYSNYGTWVEISAPGGDQGAAYGSTGGVLSTINGNQYAYMQGTSMACPHMSGIAALALSNRTHQMTNTELWNQLSTGVVNIDKYNPSYLGQLGTGAIDALLAIKNNQTIAPASITNVSATDLAQEFAKLSWTVPADADDGQPLYFNIYYSKLPLTTLVGATKVTIKNDSLAGKTFNYELDGLLGLTHYYLTIISTDRWGNASAFSNIFEFTTNEGPAIAVTPVTVGGTSQSSPTWIIDTSISNTSTQNITIKNTAAGLLRYSSFMRPRTAISSPTFEDPSIIYPVVPSTAVTSLQLGNVGSEDDGVVKLYNTDPAPMAFTAITKKIMIGSVTNLIGETDTTLPNSAASQFIVTETGGFNLTNVRMTLKLTRAATTAEPVVVEVYNSKGPFKENRLFAQTYTSASLVQQTVNITLSEQLYFAQGESFWVVFHIPNGNLFPLGMGYDLDPNFGTQCYYSSNVGTTWITLDEAINDKHFVWGMEAISNNANIGTYLSLAPASGDVSGLNQSSAVITADANNLINGNYAANLVLPSNDAATPELRVPVYLKVSNHQPVVKMIDVINYNSVFVGSKMSFDIVMDNQGFGKIQSMTAAGSYVISGANANQFIIEGSKPSTISARDQAIVRVSYVPTVAGAANATLTILGKSGNNTAYTYTVSLFGNGAATSTISITPGTQVKTPVTIGTPTSASITVQNTGGYPLKYFIPGCDTKGVSDNWPSTYHKYGYKYRTNYASDPNPITYGFQDISTTGVDITSQILTYKTYASIDIGFDFPYYDKVMSTIYVAKYGFTTFDNSVQPINQPSLNNKGNPKGYLSPVGTILNFSAQGKVLYQKLADRLIIQYDNVTDGSGHSLTAQMVLFYNGDIRFYYDKMSAWPVSYIRYLSILMENLDQNDGILINNGTKQVSLPSGTALGFDYPGPNIITGITNGSGILAPGASSVVTVSMNTTNLSEGLLNRSINFISNDPLNGQSYAMIQLDVTSGGTAVPVVSTNNIAFGNVFQGANRSQAFTIKNNGTSKVNISSMTFTNGMFTVSGGTPPLSVDPHLYKDFSVVIPTGTITSLSDDLVITYADATTSTIHVTGNVVAAPAISADLTAVNQTLNYRDSVSVPYSIQNTGAADLEVAISGKQWATFAATGSTPTSVTYEVNKENKGGVYQWIDIRKTGIHLPMAANVFDTASYWRKITLPFAFEYYGVKYTKIKLGDNGVASFEKSPLDMIIPDNIPSTNFDGAMIMPYWTFGTLSSAFAPVEDAGLFYQAFDDKVIITWSNLVNNFGGMGDPMSAQMFLYKNGTIKFQYRVEDFGNGGDQTSTFTYIGLQKNSTEGIMISPRVGLDYGSSTGLAYVLNPVCKHVVAAGATLNGNINFNSYNVYGGTYNANLKIISNAPNQELQLKPVQLIVNGAATYVAPDSIKFGQIMINNPQYSTQYFEIDNNGSAPLNITNMKRQVGSSQKMDISAWVFGYDAINPPFGYKWMWSDVTGLFCTGCPNAPITVGANEKLLFQVSHYPSVANNYNEGLIVTNNVRLDTIRITSKAYKAPGLVVTTTPVSATSNTLTEVFAPKIPFSATNTNNGQGNLNYSLAIEYGRVAPSSVEMMATTPSSNQVFTKDAVSLGGVATSSINTYNRTLAYTNITTPETFVGTGGGSPLTVATKYNAGPLGFNLSHVETFVRVESLTSGNISVEIRAGGTSVATAAKVGQSSYAFTSSGSDSHGSWIVLPLDKAVGIYPNENFYVLVTMPLGIKNPLGLITDPTTTSNRYTYYDATSATWGDINDVSGFHNNGWMMVAGEMTAGNTSWLNITSPLTGSIAPGVQDSVRLTIDSQYATRGDQIANIVMTTNDPLKLVTKIPVSLHANEAPKFSTIETVVVSEKEVRTINIAVTDKESNTFTVAAKQTYTGMTYNYASGQLSLTLSPDYGSAGNYSYTFVAIDQYNAVSEMTLQVAVVHTNRAPVFKGNLTKLDYTTKGSAVEYEIADFFSDPDGDAFTFTILSSSNTVASVFTSFDAFVVKPNAAGTASIKFEVTDSFGAKTTYDLPVNVAVVMGVENQNAKFDLQVYPNPTQGKLIVRFNGETGDAYNVRVSNVLGVSVTERSGQMMATNEMDLSLSHLPAGIYFVEVTDGSGKSVCRIVKD